MDGSFVATTSANIKRNVNGGIVGGIIGVAYAWHSKGSIFTHGLFGFVAGAFITGLLFPAKGKKKKDASTTLNTTKAEAEAEKEEQQEETTEE